jgi:DNA-binding LacI/PurR family transcriptional regulator
MEDGAHEAGVAVSTVSYAINGTRPISAETRHRIEAAMDALGYRPHAVARALASRRSRIIAVALPTERRGLGRTELDFVSGAVDAANELDYHVVVWPAEIHDRTDVETMTSNGLVDGVLLMEVCLDDDRVEALTAAGRPLAMIGRTADPSDLAHVDIDFEQTLDEAVEHLHRLGHHRIAFVNHDRSEHEAGYGPAVRALDAYDRAMTRRRLEPISRFCGDDPAAGAEVSRALLTDVPDLTAVIVMNEPAVPGLYRAATTSGRTIPDDLSVVSVVSSQGVAQMSIPALTVFEAPSRELGHRGVELLLAVLDERSADITPELMPCRLVVGDSTGPPPI